MRKYTTDQQTAKLIELGLPKPKGWCVEGISSRLIMYKYKEDNEDFNYSIGELLSFLPKEIKVEKYVEPAYLQMLNDEEGVWEVGYTFYGNGVCIKRYIEFIDCLFQMCVRLKEEGVI